jgi:hypothetical protein
MKFNIPFKNGNTSVNNVLLIIKILEHKEKFMLQQYMLAKMWTCIWKNYIVIQ